MIDESPIPLTQAPEGTSTDHYVTAMLTAGGVVSIACRCGELFSAFGMRNASVAYDKHRVRVRHERRGDKT